MSYWTKQKLDMLYEQFVQRLCTAEMEFMAAQAVLSKIETTIVIDHLWDECGVTLGRGVCTLNIYREDPINVVVEKIHPIPFQGRDHVGIEFRAFTKRGKPCKTTRYLTFEALTCFIKKT